MQSFLAAAQLGTAYVTRCAGRGFLFPWTHGSFSSCKLQEIWKRVSRAQHRWSGGLQGVRSTEASVVGKPADSLSIVPILVQKYLTSPKLGDLLDLVE